MPFLTLNIRHMQARLERLALHLCPAPTPTPPHPRAALRGATPAAAAAEEWPTLGADGADFLFEADFATGDLSEFGGASKTMREGSIEVVSDAGTPSGSAAKITIFPENVFNENQLRTQLNGPKINVEEGSDTYMSLRLSMRDAPKGRDNFLYWEGEPPPGSWNNVVRAAAPSASSFAERILLRR